MEAVSILSTYLTAKPDPQRLTLFAPDRSELVDGWYKGVCRHNGVIFHDNLSCEFMAKYPKVEFVKVNVYRWSANDARFIMFRDYLLERPHIKGVFMTDLFDVTVNLVPQFDWDLNLLYVSNEGLQWTNSRWAVSMFKKCSGFRGLLGKTIFNPGVWGGNREVVLEVLNAMIDIFDKIDVAEKNCNMLVFNEVIHRYSSMQIVTGYPLHSRFRSYDNGSDAYFIHK
jgi:hypothetical protein